MFKLKFGFVLFLAFCSIFPALLSGQNLTEITKLAKRTPFSFTIKSSASTSAGVYKKDGTLLRTLWSAVKYNAGTFTEIWDGLDDEGKVLNEAEFEIKVLSSNVKYEWEGARIGNTSTALTGSAKHRLYEHITDMVISGSTAYVACGYNEAFPSQYKFSINTPQQKTWIGAQGGTDAAIYFLDTDGLNVYWSGFDPLGAKENHEWESFVFATKVTDDKQVDFGTNGSMAHMEWGHTYSSVLSRITSNANSDSPSDITSPFYHVISGLGVQKKGNYLFVSRSTMSTIKVYNKTTGAFVRDLIVTGPGKLCIDINDNMWLKHGTTLEKYTINSDGTISTTGLIKDATNIQSFTVSPDGTVLTLTDIGTQQVKAYNNTTGASLWTLGQSGGYLTDATVTNTKFAFKDITNYDYYTYIAYQPDGTFWVGDGGNFRLLHFNKNRSYIEVIQFLQNAYSCAVDPNNPKRVFANYCEFAIDYTKPLDNGANGSWTFVKNWGPGFNSKQFDGEFDHVERLRKVVTLSNGRTYGILRSRLGGTYPLMEFVEGGIIRNTGIDMGPRGLLDADGAYINCNGFQLGFGTFYTRRALVSFDGSNNPQWSSTSTTLASLSTITGKDPIPWENARTNPISDNHVVYFDYSRPDAGKTRSDGYHLGVMKKGDNKWLWKTAPSTFTDYTGPFPEDGAFDIGNGTTYPGGTALMNGNNLFWNYKGEFYKSSQTNVWNQVDINTGLYIGQFGVVGAYQTGGEAPAEMSGNVFTGGIAKIGDTIYIYHNDEGVHSAVHRWKVTGLNTIEIHTAILVLSEAVGLEEIDLMEGLPSARGITLVNNTAGWSRNPETDITSNSENNYFIASTGAKTYDKFKSTDVHVIYRQGAGKSMSVVRTLENSAKLASWALKGKINFDGNEPTQATFAGGSFLEVLDVNDKIITRFDIRQPSSNDGAAANVMGNDKIIAYWSPIEKQTLQRRNRVIEITADEGMLSFTYGEYPTQYTTKLVDVNANWARPAKLRMTFFTKGNGDNYLRQMDISEMRFVKSLTTKSHPTNYFRSRESGDWHKLLTWESSPDSAVWVDASLTPDSLAKHITIVNGHTVSIDGIETVDHVTISNGGVLNIASTGAIIVNDNVGEDIFIEKGGKMIIKSDAFGTGRIGKSSGTISGEVTVERYLPAKAFASYRMLSPSINTTNSIRDNWQEGANKFNFFSNSNPAPGFGTHITGSLSGANGFDASISGQPSLFTFDQTPLAQAWIGINNTNVNKLDAKKGYLLYVRGDRSLDLNDENAHSTTTLRATGTILSGEVNYTVLEGDGRNNVIANPYASPIDWLTLYETNKDAFENYYILWDPNVGSKGGYVTVDISGTTSVRTSTATTIIQTGQAFIVKTKKGVTSPTLKVYESHKVATNNPNAFRTSGTMSKLYASLYYTDGNGIRSLADGVLSRFNESYASGVDGDDAGDISNFDENIAFNRNGQLLSIESRPLATINDTLFLSISNMKPRSYEWQFNSSDFDLSMLTQGFLKDKYLGTEIPINIAGTTIITFAITSDPASADTKRFSIIFQTPKVLPLSMLSVRAYEQNNGVNVDWRTTTEINMDKYEIERSIDGHVFSLTATLPAKGTSTSMNNYIWFDNKIVEGYNYYRIRSVGKDGSSQYSEVVRVLVANETPGITILQNPVKSGDFSIQLNGFQKGSYTLRLLNVAGQIILSRKIDHAGGSAIQILSANSMATGVYEVQVAGNNLNQTANCKLLIIR